ncbi:MAG: ATP-binding protein [Clostridiales Family XIII bacterium]|jgi:predicted AAA+ superfamily ATPase|nr:ATP-binding protein [Clostridiales Family XIII bacterium]
MIEKSINELILYKNLSSDPVLKNAWLLFSKYVEGIDAERFGRKTVFSVSAALWYDLQREMLAIVGHEEVQANYWQNYLCRIVGASDNIFSRLAEKGTYKPSSGAAAVASDPIADAVFELAAQELVVIRELYALDFELLANALEKGTGIKKGQENFAARKVVLAGSSRRQRIHEALTADTPLKSVKILAEYYYTHGAGVFEAYDSFLWEGHLMEVRSPDPIRMDDLIGYESQKKALIENAERLLAGLPTSNVLLYGDSGTGKSSSVKALINGYKDRGLKLIAIPKNRIGELPDVIDLIADRGVKVIIFIDDLSFEESESSYKAFKSVLEGGVNARPQNAFICVTSNRRNIVKEVWKDREGSDDVHLRDNLQEKRSLSERFGITLVYMSPQKDEYLEIVERLAQNAGIALDRETLFEQALTWEIRHGGRSGRTARQFVDALIGQS